MSQILTPLPDGELVEDADDAGGNDVTDVST